MRRFRIAIVLVVVVAVVSAVIVVVHVVGGSKHGTPSAKPPTGSSVAPVNSHPTGSYVLTATNTGPRYAPTFTGNGELGVRVPPAGQGYAAGPVVASDSEVAGFYAQQPGGVQVRANIPTWSTLGFSDAGQSFSLTQGVTRDWRQSIDFHTGVITTTASWTSPAGHVTDLSYEVSTDRARADVGLVRLVVTPRWSGTVTVTDEIDGIPATLSTERSKGTSPAHRDWVVVRADGTNIDAAIATNLVTSANVNAATQPLDLPNAESAGEQLAFPVVSGQRYTITKYVGVDSSAASGDALVLARQDAGAAASDGYDALQKENDTAWASMWAGRIDVLGNPALATAVNASEFYLWSSVRDGVDWSISPAGLSSNGYNGHVFWDADTWMYPALLAQHPDLAATMNTYRSDRLAAAAAHAHATGARGVRFPWESALDGTEQIPPPASVFSEGLYEQHITADVAIAQWQYYLATGDKQWLAAQGWPVISGAAQFWASRVTLGADGRYHLNGMTGPDEYNENVNDEAYTNAAAITTLQDAAQAAAVLGVHAPASWARIASKIVVGAGAGSGAMPEFSSYRGQLVKQADVTMLEYPLGFPMAPGVAQADVDYYAPRTDPNGPSMSDAINAIDTAALASPGCASYVYMQRSETPFVRDGFDQLSETRTGGAFTFMTGIGGFLQEFLYGVSGLRWNAGAVQLAPSLTGELGGVVLDGLSWHGRRFTVAVAPHATTVSLESGAALPVRDGATVHTVTVGHPLTLATDRPDLAATGDVLRCGRASATSSQLAAPALAAVDGSVATGWQPETLPASLTVAVAGGARTLTGVTVAWGRQWPAVVALNQPPAPGPVTTLRPSSYTVAVSANGTTWRTVATVSTGSGTNDFVHFPPVRARFVSVRIGAASGAQLPLLDELTAGT